MVIDILQKYLSITVQKYTFFRCDKPSKNALKIFEVMDKKRHVVLFRLTEGV